MSFTGASGRMSLPPFERRTIPRPSGRKTAKQSQLRESDARMVSEARTEADSGVDRRFHAFHLRASLLDILYRRSHGTARISLFPFEIEDDHPILKCQGRVLAAGLEEPHLEVGGCRIQSRRYDGELIGLLWL